MCTGLEGLAIASIIGSTAMTAVGQIQQGEYQSDMTKEQNKQAQFNAQDARDRGLIAEEEHRAKVKQIRGSQLAILGASGVETTTGTPAAVMDQTTELGELDALRLRSAAEREAWGMEREGMNALAEGKMAKKAAGMNAAGTIMAGASKAYGTYRSFYPKG